MATSPNSSMLKRFRLSRRTTLKLILAAAGFASRWSVANTAQSDSILKRQIPGSGESIPAVGLGTSDEFGNDPGQDLEPLREVLRRFVSSGGTLIDTAPAYGDAETVIGDLVAELGIANQLFLATKVRTRGRQAGIEQMQRSERLLHKRPLDLIQVHSLVDVDTQLENLRRWKDAGRVRHIGITHSRVSAFEELERLMQSVKFDFVQFNYSFTELDAEQTLLPLAADKGIAVLVNRPFENGAMFRRVKGKPLPEWASEFDCNSWAQFSLKYILAHPAVTCVIPATSNPDHLVDNMGAGLGALPDARTRRRMREYVASL
ncbi:MAG: aldo/keto reductase [Gammaproteobacteria bacterium]|nr:aldo/keto reductase [Gammaproteobacteria bacterium]